MSVKIRLQRHGKKGKPFYWVVAADARSKRDGKFLEKLGTYNPNTNPATIDLNIVKAAQWLHNGAQPTDTARAILSYKGALLKHHLDGGVRKGALTQEQADAKLAAWLDEKANKVDAKKVADFVNFAKQYLGIDDDIKVALAFSRTPYIRTTAYYNFSIPLTKIYAKDRAIIDICRSIAHELVHHLQYLEGRLLDAIKDDEDGSPIENEANAVAGVIIRKKGSEILGQKE